MGGKNIVGWGGGWLEAFRVNWFGLWFLGLKSSHMWRLGGSKCIILLIICMEFGDWD